MKIKIHRGTHEIGGSCVELQNGSSRIVVDLGMPLVGADGTRFDDQQLTTKGGPELVTTKILPDISGLYAWDLDSEHIDSLFISHAHMDHYGLADHIRADVPVYCGAATCDLMKITSLVTPFAGIGGQVLPMANQVPVQCGNFKITPFLVDHSAFDAYALLIETDGKNVFYSGDLREHGRKPGALPAIFKGLSGIKVDVLLLEGTTLGRPDEKVVSEEELEAQIIQTIGQRQDICLACCSGQNIDRLVTFYRVALRCKRTFVIDVYTANILNTLHKYAQIPYPSVQFPQLKVFFPYWLSRRLSESGHEDMLYRFKNYKISRKEIEEKPDKVLMLVRSSMVSDLNKISFGGGTFIYSMWKGYQQDASMARLLAFSQTRSMDCHYYHTGGHATAQTLQRIVKAIQPGEVIPIHTLFPDDYRSLGVKVNVLNDGEVYDIN